MILIADSGSTKTEWLLVGKQGIERTFRTSGINPYFLGEEEIRRVLTREVLVELPIERITDAFPNRRGWHCGSVFPRLLPSLV